MNTDIVYSLIIGMILGLLIGGCIVEQQYKDYYSEDIVLYAMNSSYHNGFCMGVWSNAFLTDAIFDTIGIDNGLYKTHLNVTNIYLDGEGFVQPFRLGNDTF